MSENQASSFDPSQVPPEPAPIPLNPQPAELPRPAKNVGGYVIEKDVPIPPIVPPQRRSEFGEILRALEPGESFVADEAKQGKIRQTAKSAGVKVSIRATGDGKVRVWRAE